MCRCRAFEWFTWVMCCFSILESRGWNFRLLCVLADWLCCRIKGLQLQLTGREMLLICYLNFFEHSVWVRLYPPWPVSSWLEKLAWPVELWILFICINLFSVVTKRKFRLQKLSLLILIKSSNNWIWFVSCKQKD